MPSSIISETDETKTHKVQYECPQCHNPVEEADKRCAICGSLGPWQSNGIRGKMPSFTIAPDYVPPSTPQYYAEPIVEQRSPLKEAAASQLKYVAPKGWINQSKILVSEGTSLPLKKSSKAKGDWGYRSERPLKAKNFRIFGILAIVIIVAVSIFWLVSRDEANQGQMPQPSVPVVGNIAPLEISDISISEITQSSAVITWITDKPATSQVEYGISASLSSATKLDEDLVITHSVRLDALSPDTEYYYRVISHEASENAAISGTVETFITEPLPDTVPPIISEVKIADVSDATVTITWITDEKAISQIDYGGTAAYGHKFIPSDNLVTKHSVTLTGLESDKTYYFRVKSKDANGNEAVFDANQSFQTLMPIPTGPSEGKRAPDFTVYNLDGQSVTLSELQGKIVLINFWTLSCGACVAEMPDIEAVYKNWSGPKELEVLAINAGDYEIYIRNKIENEGWTLPIFRDTDRVAFSAYKISTIPRTFFIDTEGIIRKVQMGSFYNQDQIIEALNSLQ